MLHLYYMGLQPLCVEASFIVTNEKIGLLDVTRREIDGQ